MVYVQVQLCMDQLYSISSVRQAIASSQTLALQPGAVNEVISQTRQIYQKGLGHGRTNLANVNVITAFFDIVTPDQGFEMKTL